MPICPKCLEENPALGARCPQDGYYFIHAEAVKDAESDPRIGTLAAEKYVVLSLISEGGMGAVYRALQLPVEREVALKVLRTELQDSNNGRDRFIQEARAVSRLSHPNIITLHDFGFENGTHPYMVMEYAPGTSLARWLRRDDLTLERIVHVTAQILSALAEAHKQGIVHRDLKPENIIISKTGSDEDFVKLLDFGIARMINEGATRGLTRDGEVFGTPHYMAPEQGQGKNDIGPQADVYAMGIMLYELLCGEAPFDASSPLAVLYMHINDPMPPLRPRAGLVVPPALEAVVAKATAKVATLRYRSADDMHRALLRAVGADSSTTFPRAGVSQEFATAGDDEGAGVDADVLTLPAVLPPHLEAARRAYEREKTGNHGEAQASVTLDFEDDGRRRTGLLVAAAVVVIAALAGIAYVTMGGSDAPTPPEVAGTAEAAAVEPGDGERAEAAPQAPVRGDGGASDSVALAHEALEGTGGESDGDPAATEEPAGSAAPEHEVAQAEDDRERAASTESAAAGANPPEPVATKRDSGSTRNAQGGSNSAGGARTVGATARDQPEPVKFRPPQEIPRKFERPQ